MKRTARIKLPYALSKGEYSARSFYNERYYANPRKVYLTIGQMGTINKALKLYQEKAKLGWQAHNSVYALEKGFQAVITQVQKHGKKEAKAARERRWVG